ncbi:MAG: tetratricopeptide repeat protein [Gammaproteobacteria bacterium]
MLFAELKRRNVLRVAAAYVVAAWLVIQVVETIFPLYGLSDASIRLVIALLAIGLVPVVVLAWAFELTPEGLKRDKDVDHSRSISVQTGKKLDRAIIVVLALALGYFAIDKFVLSESREASIAESARQEGRNEALVESYGDKSIAVLPFVDMSPDKDQEYMSDGIAEELLNLLAKIPDLRVVSRSSAFAFKGKDINVPTVADQLNVAYVLEGSVRQAGDQLRITAQLIEAGTDTHLWSETYDRKLENIFQIQDEISAKVVEELKITLLGETPRSQQIDEQAYKMALQARYFWNRRSEGDGQAAFDLYQQALELAPEYAPAWAGISVAYRDLARRGRIPEEEGLILAREAAEKALQLDPKLADAHIRMGQVWGQAGEYAKQREAIETALALEPNNSTALAVMANVYMSLGEFDKAIAMYQQAEAVDPMGALWPGTLVEPYLLVGHFDDAENAASRAYDLNDNELMYRTNLTYAYVVQGGHDEEVLQLLQDEALDWQEHPDNLATRYLHLAIAYHALGRQDEADETARKLDALDYTYEELMFVALHSLQGDLDRAFASLNEMDVVPRYWLETTAYFLPMMNDPRWQPALERFESIYETSD